MKLLYKSVSGLLYQANRFGLGTPESGRKDFDAADYTVGGAGGNTLSISNGQLLVTRSGAGSNGFGYVRLDAVPSRAKVYVFGQMSGAGGFQRLGIVGHLSDIVSGSEDGINLRLPHGGSSDAGIVEHVAGGGGFLDQLAGQNASGSHSFWLFLDGTAVIGYDTHTLRNWAAAAAAGAGQVGVWRSGSTPGSSETVISLFVFIDRYIAVNGLTNGDVVEIRGITGTVLATATSSGATVQLDFHKVTPTSCAYLFVKRGGVDIAQYTVPPAENGWIVGGDTYTLDETIDVVGDAIHEPVSEPLARRFQGTSDKTYIGGIGQRGEIKISSLDHGTGELVTVKLADLPADWHNAPVVLVDATGYIWVFYSKHAAESQIYYRKSTSPEDISAWGAEQTLTFGGAATYLHAFQASNGTIVVWTRHLGGGSTWSVRFTTDGGSSWSAARQWVTGAAWTYLRTRQHSDLDTVTVVAWLSPGEAATHDVYLFTVDLVSGNITVPGDPTVLANLYTGTALTVSNTLLIYDWSDVNETLAIPDVNEHGEVLLTIWDPADPENTVAHKYLKVAANGAVGALRTIVSGAVVGGGGTVPGGTLAGEGLAILIRYSVGEWGVWKYTSVDEGATWAAGVRIDVDPEVDVPVRARPRSVRFSSGAVIYARALKFDPATYTSYGSDLVFLPGPATVTITGFALPPGIPGVPYSGSITAESDDPVLTWSIVSGSLPPGLVLDEDTGAITGTPLESGSYTFTVRVETTGAESDEIEVGISIATSLLEGFQGQSRIYLYDEHPSIGSVILAHIPPLLGGRGLRAVNGKHSGFLTGRRGERWLAEVKIRRPILTVLSNGEVFWWRIRGDDSGTSPETTVHLDPIDVDLGDCGPIIQLTPGGRPQFRFRMEGTPLQLLQQFAIPTLEQHYPGMYVVGTVETTTPLVLDADNWSVLRMIREIERNAKPCEFELLPIPPYGLAGFTLNFRTRIGTNLPMAYMYSRVNVRELSRERQRDDGMATVLIPLGAQPSEASAQRPTIESQAWEVIALPGGNLVQVVDPDGGPAPVFETNQWARRTDPNTGAIIPGKYMSVVGDSGFEYVEIIASTVPDIFELADVSAISIGEAVGIVANADGDPLWEIESPSGLNENGRITNVDLTNIITAQNFISNPFGTILTGTPPLEGRIAFINGDHSGTTPAVDGLPGSYAKIKQNDVLFWLAGSLISRRVTVTPTVNGAGETTLTLDSAASFGNNQPVIIFHVGEADLPDDWTKILPADPDLATVFSHRPANAPDLPDTVAVGDHDVAYQLNIGGLEEGDELYTGDVVDIGPVTGSGGGAASSNQTGVGQAGTSVGGLGGVSPLPGLVGDPGGDGGDGGDYGAQGQDGLAPGGGAGGSGAGHPGGAVGGAGRVDIFDTDGTTLIQSYTVPGLYVWTATVSGIIRVAAWGGGGGDMTGVAVRRAGAGGGAYSSQTLEVTMGLDYDIEVGAGGIAENPGGQGGSSWFTGPGVSTGAHGGKGVGNGTASAATVPGNGGLSIFLNPTGAKGGGVVGESYRAMVYVDETADVAGQLQAQLNAPVTVPNGAPITITRPPLGDYAIGEYVVGLLLRENATGQVDLPDGLVSFNEDTPDLWGSARLAIWSPTRNVLVQSAGSYISPRVELRDSGGVIATALFPDANVPAGTLVVDTIRAHETLAGPGTRWLRIKGVQAGGSGEVLGEPMVFILGSQLHTGEEDAPFVLGSSTNRLVQYGLALLAELSVLPEMLAAAGREQIERWTVDPPVQRWLLGQSTKVRVEDDAGIIIDSIQRTNEIDYSFLDPSDTIPTLGRVPLDAIARIVRDALR